MHCRRHAALAVTALGLTLLAASAPAQTTTTLTYQGAIRKSGVPYDGSATITLALFDAPSGGNKVSNTLAFNGVQVDHGVFTVAPDFGPNPFSGAVRYVEVAFTGAGDGGPTVLPRQALTAAPLSASTRGIFVDMNNHVGIGTTSPAGILDVIGPDSSPPGVNGPSINLQAGGGADVTIGPPGTAFATPGGGVFLTGGAGGNGEFILGGAQQGGPIVLAAGPGGAGDFNVNGGPGGSVVLRPGAGGPAGVLNSSSGSTGAIFADGFLGVGTSLPQKPLHVKGDGGVINVEGLTHAFIQFYPLGFASGRKAYIGTPNSGSTDFNVQNEAPSGTLNLSAATVKVNGSFINASDARDKHDVREIGDATALVEKLKGVRYRWNERGNDGGVLPQGEQIGFLAQDVEKVLPELVATGSDGRKGVSYVSVVPLLTEAVKEQARSVASLRSENEAKQREIDELRARLDALEARLAEQKEARP